VVERPWDHTDDLRNEEPPDEPDNVRALIPRCKHPFVDMVCTDCGCVIAPTRMHPEET
jgi:hypothetical protein